MGETPFPEAARQALFLVNPVGRTNSLAKYLTRNRGVGKVKRPCHPAYPLFLPEIQIRDSFLLVSQADGDAAKGVSTYCLATRRRGVLLGSRNPRIRFTTDYALATYAKIPLNSTTKATIPPMGGSLASKSVPYGLPLPLSDRLRRRRIGQQR